MLTNDDFAKLRHMNLKKHPRAMLREAMTNPQFWTPITSDGESDGFEHRRYAVARELVKRGLAVSIQRRVGGRQRLVLKLTPVGVAFCRIFASEILFGGPIRSNVLKTRSRRLGKKLAGNRTALREPPAATAAA